MKNLNYKLFGILILFNLIPAIYSSTRVFFLGTIPNAWSFSIAGQISWLNIFYEIINESLMLSIPFILGYVIKNKKEFQQRMIVTFLIVLSVYLLVTCLVIIFLHDIVSGITNENLSFINKTVSYIRLEAIAKPLNVLFDFVILVFTLRNNQKKLFSLLIIKSVSIIIFDYLFMTSYPLAFHLGINGIAYTNIATNALLLIYSCVFFKREIELKTISFSNLKWIKEWIQISSFSALETLVRNLFFLFIVIKMVNYVHEAGNFWVTNGFIWNWLLLPVTALGSLVKQDVSTHKGASNSRINAYLKLTSIFIILWLISIPTWGWFVHTVLGIKEFNIIVHLTLISLIFYIAFAYNNVIDSYFYGMGKTNLMLVQSLIVNIVFYGLIYIVYKQGVFIPTLNKIAIMFGFGILFDSIITFILYKLHRQRLNNT